MSRRSLRSEIPVAVVVSPHGFGHAARACAVMSALESRRPGLRYHVVSTVPRWFFAQSLAVQFALHRLAVDVGLVQRTPLDEDLPATVRSLDRLLDPGRGQLQRLANRIEGLGCRLVIADISPLGLAAAARLGVPSVLVENFTWNWIYGAYLAEEPGLERHRAVLAGMTASADLHIQCEPVCQPQRAAVSVAPVARRPRLAPGEIRRRLGIPRDAPMVLLTMGGIRWSYRGLEPLRRQRRAWFVVPGGATQPRATGRLIELPFRSDVFHPDLVQAADVVVGKLGYSTVAEAYHGRAAMAFISRPRFPESDVLARFVRGMGPAVEIRQAALDRGAWVDALDALLERPRRDEPRADGADCVAEAILERFSGELG